MLKLLLLVVVLAVVVYAVVRLLGRRAQAVQPLRSNPDDDPDFLRDLEFRRRQQRRHGEGRVEGDSDDPADD